MLYYGPPLKKERKKDAYELFIVLFPDYLVNVFVMKLKQVLSLSHNSTMRRGPLCYTILKRKKTFSGEKIYYIHIYYIYIHTHNNGIIRSVLFCVK